MLGSKVLSSFRPKIRLSSCAAFYFIVLLLREAYPLVSGALCCKHCNVAFGAYFSASPLEEMRLTSSADGAAGYSDTFSSDLSETRNCEGDTEIKERKNFFSGENVCLYKRSDGQWKRRKDITELRVGERLFATKLDQDLLGGKTGAKIFLECGVGRFDNSTKKWHIINGMMRVGGRETKKAVVQKRLKRIFYNNNTYTSLVPVYVSKISLHEKRFEVLPSHEEAVKHFEQTPRKVSVSSLRPGQELVGKILRVQPYGAIIDIGANKHGLLHINTVAKLTGSRDVFKKNGLKEVGIVPKAEVRVSVLSNGFKQYKIKTENAKQKWVRQLELDFTKDAKEEAEKEQREANQRKVEERRAKWEANRLENDRRKMTTEDVSESESFVSVAFEDEEEEDFDEDRAIEEALGLDYY